MADDIKNKYEDLTLKDAIRIINHIFGRKPRLVVHWVNKLIDADRPLQDFIAKAWYDDYCSDLPF